MVVSKTANTFALGIGTEFETHDFFTHVHRDSINLRMCSIAGFEAAAPSASRFVAARRAFGVRVKRFYKLNRSRMFSRAVVRPCVCARDVYE